MDFSQIYHNAEQVRNVIRYFQRFKNATAVFHFDDEVIESPLFPSHIRDICLIQKSGIKIIIVPGARKRINEILAAYNISWDFINDKRVISENAIPLIKMAAFDVANHVMTCLASEKQTALIGNWVRARQIGIIDGIDFTCTGKIDKIQTNGIVEILEKSFIPIFPCIGWNAVGKPYNISSTELAVQIAIQLKADKLFFLTPSMSIEKNNFFIPQEIEFSPAGHIQALSLEEVSEVIKINDGETITENQKKIIALLKLSHEACNNNVSRVHILNGELDGTIPCEIFSDLGSGTMIYKNDYGGIRSMTIDDIPSVLNLIRPFVQDGILLPRTENILRSEYQDYIVYELDGGIRACAALHLYENEGEIAAVAVDTSCSHIGIGPKLINFLIACAKRKKIKSLFVLTTQTADWFEKLGFSLDTISSLPEKRKEKWNSSRGSKVFRLQLESL